LKQHIEDDAADQHLQRAERATKDSTEAGHETVAKFIDATMTEQKVSDNVAAERMDYNSLTIIRMFRDGRAKVSFDEVPELGDVVGAGADPTQVASYAFGALLEPTRNTYWRVGYERRVLRTI
jgi:hypothetical protein